MYCMRQHYLLLLGPSLTPHLTLALIRRTSFIHNTYGTSLCFIKIAISQHALTYCYYNFIRNGVITKVDIFLMLSIHHHWHCVIINQPELRSLSAVPSRGINNHLNSWCQVATCSSHPKCKCKAAKLFIYTMLHNLQVKQITNVDARDRDGSVK
jgi:hypothetical protein